jgi:hypothetical protein
VARPNGHIAKLLIFSGAKVLNQGPSCIMEGIVVNKELELGTLLQIDS